MMIDNMQMSYKFCFTWLSPSSNCCKNSNKGARQIPFFLLFHFVYYSVERKFCTNCLNGGFRFKRVHP